jgi:hypothetical protein
LQLLAHCVSRNKTAKGLQRGDRLFLTPGSTSGSPDSGANRALKAVLP